MMFWKTTALIAAAVLSTAAATPKTPPPKAQAPKASAKPAPAAAAKPAPKPATTAPVPDFDARYPASVVSLLNTRGGKAQVAKTDEDSVLVTVDSAAANFTMLFTACTPQGRGCKGVQFDSIVDQPGPTFAQLNAFNQTTLACRGYEDRAGKPHVVYATLLFSDDTYDHFRTEVSVWEGCIGEFHNFLKDPNEYLASAP